MLIHCTIATKDREVDIEGTKYLFTLNGEGDFVCDVKKKAHAQAMLLVPEAFELYDFDEEDEDPKPPVVTPVEPTKTDPDAASLEAIERANAAAAAEAVAAADAAAKAAAEEDDFEADGAEKVEGEGEGEDDDAPTLEQMLADPKLITVAIVEATADAELEYLFQAVTGRAPHPSAKAPKIRNKLIEELNARDAA